LTEEMMNLQVDLKQTYDQGFYAAQIEGSARSARVVVPLLLNLCPGVHSVVDVGCGPGVWLARFKDEGVERVLGLDGGGAEELALSEIEPEEYRSADFEHELPTSEHFDLCLCLEAAQHLSHATAPALVRNLCKLSDVVVFSAALPGQGGTNHLNERWLSYWAALFAVHGYRMLDCVRGRIWNDARVELWYRQNLTLFVSEVGRSRLSMGECGTSGPIDIVHPDLFTACRSDLERQRTNVFTLQAQVARLTSETRGLQTERETEVIALQAKAARLTSENSSLETEVTELRQQMRTQSNRLNVIINSTSWKVTYPFRVLVGNRRGPRPRLRRLASFVGIGDRTSGSAPR